MTSIEKEKRRTTRFPYLERVTFRQMGEMSEPPPEVTLTGSTVDVSEGGLSVRLEGESPRKGSVVSLRLPVSGLSVRIPILSEVRWVREIFPRTYHIGLMFIA